MTAESGHAGDQADPSEAVSEAPVEPDSAECPPWMDAVTFALLMRLREEIG